MLVCFSNKLPGANHRSVRLPEGMNSLFPAKCLVRTGPDYRDEGCTHTADIEVDLIPPGEFHCRTRLYTASANAHQDVMALRPTIAS
jgi:hypothetical protein